MKKLFLSLLALLALVTLTACGGGRVLEDEGNSYFATGNFAGWGDAIGRESNKMEAVALNDSRVAAISSELRGATALYILAIELPTTDAGWGETYTVNGASTFFNGNQTVKVVRTTSTDQDVPLWWGPSPESGQFNNLTPNTLFMPRYIDDNSPDYDADAGTGHWNTNPVALEPGNYYIVFAVINGARYMGLVAR
jgi:hypothetical protein